MIIHVLLYDAGKDNEGIHSLELNGETIVLMFENQDDAIRYSVLLEAQDFPTPSVESIERSEIEQFCLEAGYKPRFVETGFVPKTQEERILLSPPEASKDVSHWNDERNLEDDNILEANNDLEDIRKRLEDLL
tara:strand:+ start:148 stop:546 length:399 start_codon:yes stop_codon:yes gene_type:complete